MYKTPPDVTLAGPWKNIIETVVITLDTPDIPGYITKIVADIRQVITNYQADLNMVMMVPQIACYSHQTKNVRERSGSRQPVGSFGINGFAF